MATTDPTGPAIHADGVRKVFPGRGAALDGFDLSVAPGTIHGLLGPNGAGKTTAVRILTTLAPLDGGRALVAGRDVARDRAGVRARIGVAGQFAAVDEVLTGRQNLDMFARLNHLGRRTARARTTELLDRFDLAAAADRPVRHYSGGMRRRLDLAVSLLRAPGVLFLDEPTTGLDPRSRAEVWDAVRMLADTGTTVLLTTQYLEEADRLCSRVTFLGGGRAVAEGSPDDLKSRVGGARVGLAVPAGRDLGEVVSAVASALGATPDVEARARRITLPLPPGSDALARLDRGLRHAGLTAQDATLTRPDLDEAFLHLTGHQVSDRHPSDRHPEGASR